MRKPRPIYLDVRRWVDSRLSSHGTPKEMILIAFLPFLPLALLQSSVALAWVPPSLWAVIWIGFVGWRGWRLMQTVGIKSARDYDRRAKFGLPPEYATSESLLAHQRRERRRGR